MALRTLDERGHATDLSYAELCRQTNKFANLLKALGVGRGETVFTLLGRVPELYVTVLGALKNGSVVYLNSLDFLSFVEELTQHTGAQLTADDYPASDSVTDAVNLLTTRAPAVG